MTLGEYLRQEREKRGITIEQVASATKIGVKTLHALEGDQYAELPAKPFVRGFVTSYARFIALDPKEILTRFGTFIDSKAHDRPNRDAGHSGYAFEKREGEQSRTVLWVVMGSFVVLGGVAAIFVKKPLHQHHGSQADKLRAAYSVPSPVASPVAPGEASQTIVAAAAPSPTAAPMIGPQNSTPPAVVAVEVASPVPLVTAAPSLPAPVTVAVGEPVKETHGTQEKEAPVAAPSPVANTSVAASADQEEGPSPEDPLNSGLKLKPSEIKYKVVFKATESAWVRYKVDHKPVTQFVFRMGKTLVLRAKESIRFQVSPPKALTFSYKGSGFKPIQGDEHLLARQNDATLFFPYEIADSIEEPFPTEKALSNRSVPAPRPTSPLATPSP